MSAHYHTDFHPHVKPARGAPALVRRLRGRLVRRKVYRYRLPAHRTEHEAGHQPAERRALKVPAEAARRARRHSRTYGERLLATGTRATLCSLAHRVTRSGPAPCNTLSSANARDSDCSPSHHTD